MPRVRTKMKNRAGRAYRCTKCSNVIMPGQRYHEWKFRYGGTYRQHEECGYPRPSQLTQSKLSIVYAAQEDAGVAISEASDADSISDALNDMAQAARDVAEEYREAVQAMNMEGSGNENEERADALENYADNLEGEAGDIGSDEWVADVGDGVDITEEATDSDGYTKEEWLDNLRLHAAGIIDSLEL